MTRLLKAIETDWNHREGAKPSRAEVQPAWIQAMCQILAMPVPERDEPAPVSGEISAAR